MQSFVAIDFETSAYDKNSACSVGMVRVEGGRVVAREVRLIRPPQRQIRFTEIHGITWNDVQDQPRFGAVWSELSPMLAGVEFLAAHNASFDRSVLYASCDAAGMERPNLDWECSMKLARSAWNLRPTKLSDVALHIGFRLDHHEALSDAECCAAAIVAAKWGAPLSG